MASNDGDDKQSMVKPVFIEPRIVVSQFKLEEESSTTSTQPVQPSASASAK